MRFLLIALAMSGCSHIKDNWYAELGTYHDKHGVTELEQIPTKLTFGVLLSDRCRADLNHYSSFLGGPPFRVRGSDAITLNMIEAKCMVGPGGKR